LRRGAAGWVADGLTSPTNIAAYLWSTVAAEDLRLIPPAEADRRIGQTLATLAQLERSQGFFFNWYDPATGKRARVWTDGSALRPFLSVVDNGWLAAALILVGNTRPEFRAVTETILQPMNFGFFYDPFDPSDPIRHPGLLRGGYWPDNGTFTGFHYGVLNTEPRIASYIGIARGELPVEHYYRMFRFSDGIPQDRKTRARANTYVGVPVSEGGLNYRGMQIVPTWDGTMFEALMVSLLVPEADWAPRSWGVNHPLYVRAQIEYARDDARLGYWGISAASAPAGGYSAYGVAPLGVRTHGGRTSQSQEAIIAPYASFLALPFAPREALSNLRALSDAFPVYSSYGFLDSVDVVSGQVSDRVLILDQGMILAALSQVIGSDALRCGFSNGPVEETIRPLIALERFDSGLDPASRFVMQPGHDDHDSMASLASLPIERSLLPGRSRLGGRHFVEGLITAASVSAVLACRARVSKNSPTNILSL
jgi:hypothetical protein